MNAPLTTAPVLGMAEWMSPTGPRSSALTPALLDERIFESEPSRVGNAYPNQRNYHGYYCMLSTGAHVWHESLLERSALRLLDYAGDVVAAATQPVKLQVAGHVHTPDILVLHFDGTQTLFDVKPSTRIDARARAQFELTARICAHVGWNYRVLTECHRQVRVNLEYLNQFGRSEFAAPDIDTVVCEYREGWTVNDLVAAFPGRSRSRARAWAMNVLWNRYLVVDLDRRLTGDSVLSRPTMSGLEAVDAIR